MRGVRLFRCVSVRLCRCWGCAVVWLCRCGFVELLDCAVVPLYVEVLCVIVGTRCVACDVIRCIARLLVL